MFIVPFLTKWIITLLFCNGISFFNPQLSVPCSCSGNCFVLKSGVSNNAGEVVGSLSFSVGHGANILRKVASARMFHQAHDHQNIISYPLNRRVSYIS